MLSTIANIFNGDSINEQEKAQKYYGQAIGYNYIGTKDVNFNHTINYNNGVKIPYDTSFKIAHKNTPLLCIEGGSAGRKIGILEEDVCFGNKLCAFETYSINSVYLFYFLQCSEFVQIFKHNTQGIIGGVSINTIKKLPFLLPPLEEQARIVKRIEELFVQIDIIDQNQADIDTLYEEFRKRTLTLAIQGKLVPQDPNDEPASVLLERIRAEKKVKLDKKYVDSYIYKGDDNCYYEHIAGRAQDELVEVPFDIPDNWVWVRVNNCCDIRNGFTPSRTESKFWDNGTIPWFTVEDINSQGKIIKTTKQYITELATTKERIVPANSLLLCCTASVGIFAKNTIALTTNQQFNGLTIKSDYTNMLSIDYLFAIGEYFSERLHRLAGKTTFEFVSVKKLGQIILPIPPLAEQNRIVAKINEIFAML